MSNISPVEFATAITMLNAGIIAWFTYKNRSDETSLSAESLFLDTLTEELAAERVIRSEAEQARDEWRERYFVTVELLGGLRVQVAQMEAELKNVEKELRSLRESITENGSHNER